MCVYVCICVYVYIMMDDLSHLTRRHVSCMCVCVYACVCVAERLQAEQFLETMTREHALKLENTTHNLEKAKAKQLQAEQQQLALVYTAIRAIRAIWGPVPVYMRAIGGGILGLLGSPQAWRRQLALWFLFVFPHQAYVHHVPCAIHEIAYCRSQIADVSFPTLGWPPINSLSLTHTHTLSLSLCVYVY